MILGVLKIELKCSYVKTLSPMLYLVHVEGINDKDDDHIEDDEDDEDEDGDKEDGEGEAESKPKRRSYFTSCHCELLKGGNAVLLTWENDYPGARKSSFQFGSYCTGLL
uniref:uncharacterized protein LOC122607945 isoform X2 n=1 Tax=Erigeron canadensis TaxID=72917 RepID=UPI001CB8D777|nr:uncharacterized protein LOC122607945 isoform X2 [Erigeron canadensis]